MRNFNPVWKEELMLSIPQHHGSVKLATLKIIQAYMEGYRLDWELSFEKDTRIRGVWRVYQKQPLYLTQDRGAYTPPFPDPTCGITLVALLSIRSGENVMLPCKIGCRMLE